MSAITVWREVTDGDGYAVPKVVGSFDPKLAVYWDGTGVRKAPDPDEPGAYHFEDMGKERLWRTAEGRYVWTLNAGEPGITRCRTRYLSEDEAEAWFAEVGLADLERREMYQCSGHLTNQVAPGRG